MKKILLLLFLLPAVASAQTSTADRFKLNTGPCVHSSGSADPNGSVTGSICDEYSRTSTGGHYYKTSGTATNTGWVLVFAGNGGGTTNTLAKFTSTGLGDSHVTDTGSLVTVTGPLTVTGDVTASANATIAGFVGSPTYASETTGWRVTAPGAADFRYLFTDEMRAKIFTADMESVLNGSELVTKSSSTISQAFTCPAAGATSTLWVNDAKTFGDAAVFVASDWVVIHNLSRTSLGGFTVSDCVGTVTSYSDGTGGNAGQQSWTFTRGSGGSSGAMSSSTVVPVNQLVVDYGVSGNGVIEQSAVDGSANVNAPYLQIKTFATSPVAANFSTRCRLGQLTGITATSEYGLLCGTFGTAGPFVRLSDQNTEIRGIPLKLFQGSTETIRLDASVPSIALGNSLPSAYGSGTGVWMGNDSSTYKFRVGDTSTAYVRWNGSNLEILGASFSLDSTGPKVLDNAGSTPAALNGYQFTSSTGIPGSIYGTFGYSYSAALQRFLSLRNEETGTTQKATTSIVAGNNSSSTAGVQADAYGSSYGSGLSGTTAAELFSNDLTKVSVGGTNLTMTSGLFALNDGVVDLTTSSDGMLTLHSTHAIAYTSLAFYRAGNLQGSIAHLVEGTTSYNTSSDARLKTDIVPTSLGLADLRRVKIDDFTFKADLTHTLQTGVLGQELETVYPQAVSKTDGWYQVDYSKLVPLTVRSIQDLDQQVQRQQAEIDQLKATLKKGGQ